MNTDTTLHVLRVTFYSDSAYD